ncbi:hypothetical protein V1477_014304 [Vespula maculifrons]|uniref:Uncharacterized protein n=1 Tax=Vespula maculifrons TaxID=7453 RepID=A0ABD2BKN5_VESMC
MVRPKGRKSELFSTNMGKEKEAVEVATYEKRRRRKRRVGGAEDEEGTGIGIGTVHCSKEISRDAGSCTGPPINDVP